MATGVAGKPVSLAPDRLEKALGWLSLVMLGVIAIAIALAKGHAQWSRVPALVWVHLATIGMALVLTPVLLWRPRGTANHRALGYVWCAAMSATAVVSLFVRITRPGHFSAIHLLSVLTIVLVPLLVRAARRHDVARHRRSVRGLVIGALLVAGFFTFPFDRLLGHWLFG